MKFFFLDRDGFDVLHEESRGEMEQDESKVDIAVLKILARPGGSNYSYDYCLIESKEAGRSWSATEDHLSRPCAGTKNASERVYGAVHVGLFVQFFTTHRGILTPMSGRLHLRNDVNAVTTMIERMKRNPLPFL